MQIVNELTEYARDIHPAMAREAVKAVGRIALAVCVTMARQPHLPNQSQRMYEFSGSFLNSYCSISSALSPLFYLGLFIIF